MRKAKADKAAQTAKEEQERKMRKEIRTGGGFNIDKLKELRAQGFNLWKRTKSYVADMPRLIVSPKVGNFNKQPFTNFN